MLYCRRAQEPFLAIVVKSFVADALSTLPRTCYAVLLVEYRKLKKPTKLSEA